MITINLQWLAVPLMLYSVYAFCWAVYCLYHTQDEGLVGLAYLNATVDYATWSIGSALVGGLIYMAFRK